jgi:hypothetical protein
MADAFLGRPAADAAEANAIARLEDSWGAHLQSLTTWTQALTARGWNATYVEETTADSVHSFELLRVRADRWLEADVTVDERESWRRALDALAAGLVRSYQLVASRQLR